MTARDLLGFVRGYRLAVQASVAASSVPQAAVVGFAVTDRFEIVFDTLEATRKVQNLRLNERAALVIGGVTDGDERTAQIEGIADEPSGNELKRLQEAYYRAHPDGRDRLDWPGLIYVRVRPTWARYSDFNHDPPTIVEFGTEELGL